MIISASRRTDIPAFYHKWFMNRIRAGWCAVPNPVNLHSIPPVELNPSAVEAIVFWSKNPAPMMPNLPELDERGYRYYFQFTLNAYPAVIEPNLPPLSTRISTFQELSERISAPRVIWRYDPLMISGITPVDFHTDQFSLLCQELRHSTRRVVVSVLDVYASVERKLAALEREGLGIERESNSINRLMTDLAKIAKSHGLEICSCAEQQDFTAMGVPPGQCIDANLINSLWSLRVTYRKDPGQRPACLCAVGKDIGVNDTCLHGCAYCYSTKSYSVAERRFREHDPDSPLLWGNEAM
ncbi:MAG: DUF1848 domain-containing protein, partial [Chloroflexota bacterium]